MTRSELRESVRSMTTQVLLWAIRVINPSRDQILSFTLHKIADHYDTRPEGRWD